MWSTLSKYIREVVYLEGCIIRIYHDAWSYECQETFLVVTTLKMAERWPKHFGRHYGKQNCIYRTEVHLLVF